MLHHSCMKVVEMSSFHGVNHSCLVDPDSCTVQVLVQCRSTVVPAECECIEDPDFEVTLRTHAAVDHCLQNGLPSPGTSMPRRLHHSLHLPPPSTTVFFFAIYDVTEGEFREKTSPWLRCCPALPQQNVRLVCCHPRHRSLPPLHPWATGYPDASSAHQQTFDTSCRFADVMAYCTHLPFAL